MDQVVRTNGLNGFSKSPSRIIGGASELLGSNSSYSSYEENQSHSRTLRSSMRSAVRMSSSMTTSSTGVNNSIVSNNYDCLATTASVYETSSDDSVDFHEYNKALRILDSEFELEQRDQNIWVQKAQFVLNYSARSLINIVCVPIYWILVQNFVFEKWILNRKQAVDRAKERRGILNVSSRNGEDCRIIRSTPEVDMTPRPRRFLSNHHDEEEREDQVNSIAATDHNAESKKSFWSNLLGWASTSDSDSTPTRPQIITNTATNQEKGSKWSLLSSKAASDSDNTPRRRPWGKHAEEERDDQVKTKTTASRQSRDRDPGQSFWNKNRNNLLWLGLFLLLLAGGKHLYFDSNWPTIDSPDAPATQSYREFPEPIPIPAIVTVTEPPAPVIQSYPEPEPIPVPAIVAVTEPPAPVIQSYPEPEPFPIPTVVTVNDVPAAQSLPDPVPSPAVITELPAPVPIPIPVPPKDPCVACPPANNIDVDALKKELTEHFTVLIKEQCASNCDCTTGRKGGGSGGGIGDVNDIDSKIKAAIKKYDSDKTGRPDLALEPSGGSVVSTRCTKHAQNKNSVVTFFGIPIWHPPNNPRTVIQPGLVPGECWSFEGSIGYIVIKLAGPSYISGFSLEHIPKVISPLGHINSAPYKFQVVGLTDYNDPSTEHVFGEYEYLDNDEPLQYYDVQKPAEIAYPYVELKILSNHGSIEFTCVYRFRVHGHF